MRRAAATKLVLVAVAAVLLLAECFSSFQGLDEVRARFERSDVLVLARDGTPLEEVREDFARRRLAWTPFAEVSPAFVRALVVTEDQRFFGHPGIDVWAMAHAATGLFHQGSLRGASTITMQLSGLLAGRKAGRRSLRAKIAQIREALAIERHWTKTEILEAYVNLVGFRGELVGIRAASRELFGKGPDALDLAESALLAAMIAKPNARDQAVAGRACANLKRLGEAERCRMLSPLLALATSSRGDGFGPHWAPHAARRWLKSKGAKAGILTTTLDARLQRATVQEVDGQLRELADRNVHDAAVVVLDNESGETLAYVGASVATSRAPEVDGIQAKRQAGSVLKPFLYELAFAENRLTAETLLDDSPLEIEVGGGIYQPRNYDKIFRGPVTAREALASSLNVPAVKVLELVGVDSYWARLKDLGVGIDEAADFFGPSLALGTVDVSLEEVTRAFRGLALRSRQDPAAGVVAQILSDRVARSSTFGLENYLSTRFYTSVKTGTSKDMRDNWCVGFSGRYTVGVWVGNFDGQPMWNVSGVTGAAPIWMKVMRHLHRDKPSVAPWSSTAVATEAELIDDPAVLARITYPTDGMVVAWDPDMPAARQAILPEVWPRAAAATLELDGKPWPRGKPLMIRSLAAGSHTLVLRNGDQAEIDRVRLRFSRAK